MFQNNILFSLWEIERSRRRFKATWDTSSQHSMTARLLSCKPTLQASCRRLVMNRNNSLFQSDTPRNVFHGLNEVHRASFRQKVKRFHPGDQRLDCRRRLPPRKRHKITRKFTSVKQLFHVTVRTLYVSRQENVVARLGVVPGIQTNGARMSASCSHWRLFGSPENLHLERVGHFRSRACRCSVDI